MTVVAERCQRLAVVVVFVVVVVVVVAGNDDDDDDDDDINVSKSLSPDRQWAKSGVGGEASATCCLGSWSL